MYGMWSLWARTCSHVNVSDSLAFNTVPPDGDTPVQAASVKAPKFRVELPVFVTVILYSIFWPTSAVSFAVVKEDSPLIRCSLTIEKLTDSHPNSK